MTFLQPTTPANGLANTGCNAIESIFIMQDNSDSMHDSFPGYIDREDAAKKQATAFVQQVDFTKDKMGFGVFASQATVIDRMGSSKNTILSDIANYTSTAGTQMDVALQAAENEVTSSPGQRYILFITDGLHSDGIDRTAAEKDAATIAVANDIKKKGITLVTVAVSRKSSDVVLLQEIASPGFAYQVDTGNEFSNAYDDISSRVVCVGPTATPIPQYSISGDVYIDTNNNGKKDKTDPKYTTGATINLYGQMNKSTTTIATGDYIFSPLFGGSYSIKLTVPPGYRSISSNPVNTTLGPDKTVDFGIVPTYTIKGAVFNDINKNNQKDISEAAYTASAITISAPGGTVSINKGTYTVSNLLRGTYKVSYTSPIPSGYILEYPLNGPPPSFTVTVGPGCKTDTISGSQCDSNGSITNLNFAITNSIPWVQAVGLDMRFDSGFDNHIPPSPSCGVGGYASISNTSSNPGIVFVGDTKANFGSGQASSKNWIVGGTAYPDNFSSSKPQLATSYASVRDSLQRAGETITNIQTLPGCSNVSSCTLPSTLPGTVFRAVSDLTLNGYSFGSNKTYIFLIKGTLTIKGALRVPVGSIVLFTAAKDIIVDKAVGTAPTCTPGNTGIEGIFSADNNIVVQGNTNCSVSGPDKILPVNGDVIVNAARGNGTFQNNRDLCAFNLQYPAITFTQRPDFILNAPQILHTTSYIYKEVAP